MPTEAELATALQKGHEQGSLGVSHTHTGQHMSPYDPRNPEEKELYWAWCVGFDRAVRNTAG